MLQIVTGMYFRDVPLNETTHRALMYTNGWALSREPIDLPIGRFTLATSLTPITGVMLEAVERLEAVRPDGEPEFVVATGGGELLNDAADVFAFVFNVACSPNLALIERSVPRQLDGRPTGTPSSILRRTFDPGVVLRDDDIGPASDFISKLLRRRRPHFEAAMRAIRTVVDATLYVGDDPSLAYTLLVAALESLAQVALPVEQVRSWDTYEPTKRRIVERAIADLAEEEAEKVKNAVLEIDQLALGRRFRSFTIAHVEPSFYREEATAALRPLRAADLPNALDVAYQLRSRNVHVLESLAPELWVIADRADSIAWEGRPVLTLEGLSRLARHVIRRFIEQAPQGVDPEFDYREYLPGKVRVAVAPQYWVWNAAGFTAKAAPRYLEGFVDLLLATAADPEESQLVDLTAVLDRIEVLLPTEAKASARRPMVALYALWHTVMDPQHHRPNRQEVLARYGVDLDEPSMQGFVARLFGWAEFPWTVEQLVRLAQDRREERRRGRGQPLPARVDVALLLITADELWAADRESDAMALTSEAVEILPGHPGLIALERQAHERRWPALLDIGGFITSLDDWRADAPDDGSEGPAEAVGGTEDQPSPDG